MKKFALLLMVAIAVPVFGELTANACLKHRRSICVQPIEKERVLTSAIAKRALLEMDVKQIPPGVLVPWPKDEPIQIHDADEISIGIYHCNLKQQTFHAHAFYPNAPRHQFNHLKGIFERTAEGKWVAKVTESQSGH